jgi:uroporphyrinogen III methyltransferase/synthase
MQLDELFDLRVRTEEIASSRRATTARPRRSKPNSRNNGRLGKVWLVGSRDRATRACSRSKAARAIAQCDVLVYDYLASRRDRRDGAARLRKDLRRQESRRAHAHARRDHGADRQTRTRRQTRRAAQGRRRVRVRARRRRGGGTARGRRAVRDRSGITSAIAAPAYAGIPITHRDHNTSFTIATGHEDPLKGYSSLDFAKLANPKQTLVFLMAMGSLAGIVAKLRARMPGDMPVGIVREGTKPTQETLVATLETIVAEVERTKFKAPAIVVIGNVVNERETIRWFDNEPALRQTRARHARARDADEFADKLWERGAEPVIAPTIAIGRRTIRNRRKRRARASRATRGSSSRARTASMRASTDSGADGGDARRFGRAKVAAIGPKTAARLMAHGIRAEFVPAEFVAESVATGLARAHATGDRILVYGAQEMRDVLAHGRYAKRGARRCGRRVQDGRTYPIRTSDRSRNDGRVDVHEREHGRVVRGERPGCGRPRARPRSSPASGPSRPKRRASARHLGRRRRRRVHGRRTDPRARRGARDSLARRRTSFGCVALQIAVFLLSRSVSSGARALSRPMRAGIRRARAPATPVPTPAPTPTPLSEELRLARLPGRTPSDRR